MAEQAQKDPSQMEIPERLPLLPIRDIVVFPYMVLPLFVGREMSVKAIEAALAGNRTIMLAAQRSLEVENPTPQDIYSVGTVGMVMRMLKLPDERIKILVQGLAKARIEEFVQTEPYFEVRIRQLPEVKVQGQSLEGEALMRTVKEQLERLVSLGKVLMPDVMVVIENLQDPGRLADMIVSNLGLKVEAAQEVLEIQDPIPRLRRVSELLAAEVEVLSMQQKIQAEAKGEMDKTQREYFLREQLKAIQKELGELDERAEEVAEFRTNIKDAKMPEKVLKEAEKQLKRLEKMHPDTAEAATVRTYLEWLVDLPWSKKTKDNLDIKAAAKVLDEDHYDLEKVKERILEYLAVRKMKDKMKGPILCFVGPPGVGKTSLGKSIARALGREFVRISLGGVRDEAEIRGHRRTYVGALPGRIIQGMKQAGTNNPVFMLDEVDKVGMDFRGDPSAALLEVLDPEQNNSFTDHYLDVEYDLSKVMFIATANVVHTIPAPLKDRMEIIALSGYTHLEKLAIGRQFLVPKQRTEQGLEDAKLTFEDTAVEELIDSYTREAGVRNVEREVVKKSDYEVIIDRSKVRELLGKAKFRSQQIHDRSEIGLATGLAWTEVGGEILSTEVAISRGKGNLILTGKLGDVMQESARAALSYVRSRAELFGLDADFHANMDIHIHVPEGAIPKDGPSAGITMATALLSAVTRIPVHRDIAMTGEITLRGKVLPVGGVKDKILAAARAGITRIILPAENERDLDDIPSDVREKMEFHLVESMDEVVTLALDGTIVPLAPKEKLAEPEKIIGAEPPVTH